MIFLYEVIDKNKNVINGKIDARSREEAIEILHGRENIIVNLFEERKSFLNINILQRVKSRDIVILSKEISLLFAAEIPALRIFKLITTQTENPYLQSILVDITNQIQKGSSISEAFRKYESVFGAFFANVLDVGEESGTLDRSFQYLADYIEKSYKTITKIKRALTYPIFIILTFFAVMWLMFAVVIPQMSQILKSFGQDLPVITQTVISTSDFIVQYGYVILVVLIMFGVFVYQQLQTERGREYIDSVKLRLPIFGNLFQKLYIAQFTGNLAVMVQTNVALPRALNSVKKVIGNVRFQKELQAIEGEVLEGKTFSQALSAHPIVGANIYQLVRVGEEAGELGKVLNTLAEFYQEEVSNTIDSVVGLIQPAVILLLGLGVGVLLGAILLPIYSLAGSI